MTSVRKQVFPFFQKARMGQNNPVGIGLFLTVVIAVVIVTWLLGPTAGAAPLTQTDIVARAIAHAHRVGLVGTPTSTVSKQMTLGEFNERLDPFNNVDKQDTQVWLVVLKGNVVHENPPSRTGSISQTNYDNIWVLLNAGGEVIGWGSQSPNNELDLSASPKRLTKWPTPANPNK